MAALLCVDDLPRLYREYFSSRAQWKAIGCALGISADDLEAIDRNHRGICEDCFREVLLKWLRKRGRKTESKLVEAVSIVNKDFDAGPLFPYQLCIAAIVILFSIVSAVPAVHLYGWLRTDSSPALPTLTDYTDSTLTIASNPTKEPPDLTSALTSAAQILKGRYRYHPVVDFELLDFTNNMPYINVTMQRAGSQTTVNFWELLNDLDSKHIRLQANEPGKLERILITGHPGAGKTTLMQYLAKEWANNGTKLRSCKVLFLIQFGRLSKEKEPQNLIELLQLSPYNDLDLKELSKEIQQKDGAGACFLLDSYDEWIWEKDFVHKLFFKFNLYSSFSILSSRPLKSKPKQPYIVHIEMVGFENDDLEKHLKALSNDTQVTNSVINLWSSKPHIKELCTLPLNMVMLLSIIKNEENLSSNHVTRTEIYSAFMNVTVKHFLKRHPDILDWDTIYLWECILNVSDSHENRLCIAFTELHRVAYEMIFNRRDTFSKHKKLSSDINKLGFVKVTEVASNGNQVRYTFHHPTFLEFFAAIYLFGLKQEEHLFLYVKNKQNLFTAYNPWLFYFGLIGAHYREDQVSAILKQLSMTLCKRPPDNYPPICHNKIAFKYIEEIGWTGKRLDALLGSTGIVVNSTLYVDKVTPSQFTLKAMEYIINHVTTHKLKIEKVAIDCKGVLFFESNNVSYAQFELVKSCLHVSSSEGLLIPLPISSIIYQYEQTHQILISACVNEFHCLLGGVTSLQSLHIQINPDYDLIKNFYMCDKMVEFYDNTFDQRILLATTLLESLGQNLVQTVSLTLGPLLCWHLSPIILGKFQLIHELKLEFLEQPYYDENGICLEQLKLFFNAIAHLHNLQKIAIIGEKDWISLDNSQDVLQKIFGLNKLKSLELYKVGLSGVKSSSWYLPHTLQELNLCDNGITDSDINVIAQGLKSLRDLRSLNLCKNSITGGSLTSLVEALTLQRNFSSLDLSNNPINDSNGIKALGSLRNLRHLKLKSTGVDIKELVNVLLSNNITLHSFKLIVAGNNRSNGMKDLLHLAQLTDLRHLELSAINNRIPSDLLAAMLKNLTKLESIKLCDLDYGGETHWNTDLTRAIIHHPHLQVVIAPCLDFNWESYMWYILPN